MTDYIKDHTNHWRGIPNWGASNIKVPNSRGRWSDMEGMYAYINSKKKLTGRMLVLESKYVRVTDNLDAFHTEMYRVNSYNQTIFVMFGTIDEDEYERSNGMVVKYLYTKLITFHEGEIEVYEGINNDFINDKIEQWGIWAESHWANSHISLAKYHMDQLEKNELLMLRAQLNKALEKMG